MISWLQQKLQKHLLLAFIIFAVLIIAFVMQIGNMGPMGHKEKTADLFFYGTPMNTEAAPKSAPPIPASGTPRESIGGFQLASPHPAKPTRVPLHK